MSSQDERIDGLSERLSKPAGSLETHGSLKTEVFEGIKTVVREHLDLTDPSILQGNTEELEKLRLVEDLRLDSIELLTLAVEVENHFQVALDEFGEAEDVEEDGEEEIETGSDPSIADPSIVTLGDLVALICEKLAANRGDSEECIKITETAGPASR